MMNMYFMIVSSTGTWTYLRIHKGEIY